MELFPKSHRPTRRATPSNSSIALQATCLIEHQQMKTSKSSLCIKRSRVSNKNKKRGSACVISRERWFDEGWERN
uniref:Putative ovule protein n=1 Tax=Solanum chacoense TaxID=4108 RepID=A0A0V0GIE2_SOLCH